jgi:hypothetical protein
MKVLHLECLNPIRNINKVLFFASVSPIHFPKPLECNFVINKINLIAFNNTTFFMKKSKTLASIP